MAHCHLGASILEVSGPQAEERIRHLANFEQNAAGSIRSQGGGNAAWCGHVFLAPGLNPGAVCNAELQINDTCAASFHPDGPEAASISD